MLECLPTILKDPCSISSNVELTAFSQNLPECARNFCIIMHHLMVVLGGFCHCVSVIEHTYTNPGGYTVTCKCAWSLTKTSLSGVFDRTMLCWLEFCFFISI